MKNQDIATTITKLGGIALIIYAILNAASYTPYLVAKPEDIQTIDVITVYLSKVGLPILIGIYLIYFGRLLIRRHIPNTETESETLANFEKTALSVMGVYLLYYAISDKTAHIVYLYKINLMIKNGAPIGLDETMSADTFSAIIATIVEIIFSLWLILGSGGMVNLFNRLRSR